MQTTNSAGWIGSAVIAGLLFGATAAGAQTVTEPDVAQSVDAEMASEETVRRLVDLADQPLDLNTASATDLAQIPALTLPLARRIVAHRRSNGPFPTVAALTAVAGVSPAVRAAAAPFLHVAPTATRGATAQVPPVWGPVAVDVTQQVVRRLDLGRGYDRQREGADSLRTTYLGSPVGLVTRVKVRSGERAALGLTLDKDPGERLRWNPATGSYGADHVSASLALSDLGPVSTLVVGDFGAAYGQGVALWRAGAFGKGRDPVGPIVRSGGGIRSRSSAEENQFFRGVAVTAVPVRVTEQSAVEVAAWVSRRLRDGSLTDAGTGTPPAITSLSSGGFHRTASELARKNAVRESNAGGAVVWQGASWQAGAAGLETWFDRPLAHSPDARRRYDPTGTRLGIATLFGDATFDLGAGDGSVHAFGEVARSSPGRWGGIGGLALTGRRSEAVVLARRYPPGFGSLYGGPIGASSGAPENESGAYAGVRMQVARDWSVGAYVDAYRFPWLRHTVARPSSGVDARLVVDHAPRPWLEHSVQIRTDARDGGASVASADGRVVDGLQREARRSVRWHGAFTFSPALTLRTRVEAVRASTPSVTETGVLTYQDVRWQPHPAVVAEGRVGLFDTDGYAARVFAYERDLRYSFSVPALQGRGQRAYLLLRLRPSPHWTVEAKYGATRYRNVRSVGSGLQETPGARIRELRVQVRWHLY